MSANKQQKVRLEARRTKVLQLTVAGGSSRAIADQLAQEGYGQISHTTVQKDLKAILGKITSDTSDQVKNQRALMNERYNRLFLSWWSTALGQDVTKEHPPVPPSPEAGTKVLSILKAMRELNGLDVSVAQRMEHSGPDGVPIFPKVEVVWHDSDSPPADVGEAAK